MLSWIHTRTLQLTWASRKNRGFLYCHWLSVPGLRRSKETKKHSFSSLSCMCTSVFEVMSVYPIDWYLHAIRREMPLMRWNKLNFNNVSCSLHMFYWSSESALHECFIAEWWRGVWIETLTLQLAAQGWKTPSVRVWIQLWFEAWSAADKPSIRACKSMNTRYYAGKLLPWFSLK